MTRTVTRSAAPAEQTPARSGRPRSVADLLHRRRAARDARRTDRAIAKALASAVTPAHHEELLLLHRLR
jgi:hypothetical protein